MKIALDVMGTDYGPSELVLGAVMAVKEYGCDVVLVGDEPTIRELLKSTGRRTTRTYWFSTRPRSSICRNTPALP